MLELLKNSQRGAADHGWLQSNHSFSFGQYWNPEQMGFGPLVANILGPRLMGETFNSAGVVDFRSLFLVPCAAALFAAVVLALFFHPPQQTQLGATRKLAPV